MSSLELKKKIKNFILNSIYFFYTFFYCKCVQLLKMLQNKLYKKIRGDKILLKFYLILFLLLFLKKRRKKKIVAIELTETSPCRTIEVNDPSFLRSTPKKRAHYYQAGPLRRRRNRGGSLLLSGSTSQGRTPSPLPREDAPNATPIESVTNDSRYGRDVI